MSNNKVCGVSLILTFIDAGLLFCMTFYILGEPFIKLIMGVKHSGHDKM